MHSILKYLQLSSKAGRGFGWRYVHLYMAKALSEQWGSGVNVWIKLPRPRLKVRMTKQIDQLTISVAIYRRNDEVRTIHFVFIHLKGHLVRKIVFFVFVMVMVMSEDHYSFVGDNRSRHLFPVCGPADLRQQNWEYSNDLNECSDSY